MTSFAYAVQVRREDGSEVAQVPVAVDWEPAREALRLAALEQGVGPEAAFLLDTELEPVWHSERGQPFLEGVLGTAPGAGIRRLFPLDYFNDAARSVTRQLISEEKLAKGDLVRCLPVAFAAPAPGAAGTDPAPRSSQGRLLPPRVPLRSGSVEQLAAESSEPATGSLPTFIPETVLQQTAELTARDSGRETGGILIGHLGRDQSTGRLFLEITAQVPAHHTEATSARLTFTPATWTDVRNALTLRNRDEIMLGWAGGIPIRCGNGAGSALPKSGPPAPWPGDSSAKTTAICIGPCSPAPTALPWW